MEEQDEQIRAMEVHQRIARQLYVDLASNKEWEPFEYPYSDRVSKKQAAIALSVIRSVSDTQLDAVLEYEGSYPVGKSPASEL